MQLDDSRVDELISLIEDSFRVREDHDPVYVDVSDHLRRVRASQHQVIFGRRGSGKSCLLVHFYRSSRSDNFLSIYVSADEVKRLGYPDLLIRLLLTIFEPLPGARRGRVKRLLRWRESTLQRGIRELRELLDRAASAEVTEQDAQRRGRVFKGSGGAQGIATGAEFSLERSRERTAAFKEEKLDYLERHLQDFKATLRDTLGQSAFERAIVLIDDFYLIPTDRQPDVVDYLHRLARGTSLYVKIGTIRHRTALVRHNGQTVGVELYQDVEPINLDQTFEDIEATRSYLALMLDSMGREAGVPNASTDLLSPDGLFALTLASGGVPRDYLTSFVESVRIAREMGSLKWLTPRTVYKGAYRMTRRTKLVNLREDVGLDSTPLEHAFQDLLNFCLREKKKTTFLISEEEAQARPAEHETIKQLMDFKLVHVVEPDTSAASGRPGRYEAYTLDFSFFMEPRRRGIEIVEFWEKDENRRRKGLREAPVYPLERLATVATMAPLTEPTEEVIEEIEAETVEPETESLAQEGDS